MAARPYSTARSATNTLAAAIARRQIGVLNAANSFRHATPTRQRNRQIAALAASHAHLDQWSRERLVRLTQDLKRNNIVARAIVKRKAQVVAGARPGLLLKSESDAWNVSTTRWLKDWFNKGFDHEGVLTFNQFARFTVRNGLTQGDGLVVFLESGSTQWIDGIRIRNPYGRADSESLVGGVELDTDGRVAGYHVARWNAQGTALLPDTEFVAAADCIFVRNPGDIEAGERRSAPGLAAAYGRIEDLDRLNDVVNKSAEMAALFAIFLVKNASGPSPLSFGPGPHGEDAGAIEEAEANREIPVLPGVMTELNAGEDIRTTNPTQPSTQYEKKLWADLQLIVSDVGGVPLELCFYRYTNNYAAGRSAIVSAWADVLEHQEWLADVVLTPIVRWRLAMAIERGEIKRVPGWQNIGWMLPGIPTLDLGAEIDAGARGIAGGMLTREEARARLGGDTTIDEFYKARERELETERRIGLQTQLPVAVVEGRTEVTSGGSSGGEDA